MASLREAVAAALKKSIPEPLAVEVTIPDAETFGHFSTNVAFRLAKERKASPLVLAEELKRALLGHELFSRVEVAGSGFLNMWISHDALYGELKRITKEKKRYGRMKLPKTQQKYIQLEFISANPTGPLTLANGRGGFLGDALANLLEAAGHTVEREYYVNDTGNQVRTLGNSLLAAQGFISEEEKFYKGEYVKEWARAHAVLVKRHQNKPEALGGRAAADFLKDIKRVIEKKSGIHFDRYTSEKRSVHEKGFVKKALTLFKKRGLTYENEGAVWLKTTEFGDDKDRVLVTQDGFPTYFLADAGHYLETKQRGFDGKIVILGPDHYGYVSRIQAAAKIVDLARSDVIITQAVRLVRGGEEVKMSKRKGEFVTFEELVDEVSPDAARFFFQMISPDTHMDFDLDLAKERSLKNPVFYLQYAHVRATGIMKKARVAKGGVELALLDTPEDIRLVRKLVEFPSVLADAAAHYAVHHVTRYGLELAKLFHNFYEAERVDGVEPALGRARMALVRASSAVLENVLGVLGVTAPEEM